MPTAKAITLKALRSIDGTINSFSHGANREKHKVWLAPLLLKLVMDHRLQLISAAPGGEGVELPALPTDQNQFPTPSNFLQCSLPAVQTETLGYMQVMGENGKENMANPIPSVADSQETGGTVHEFLVRFPVEQQTFTTTRFPDGQEMVTRTVELGKEGGVFKNEGTVPSFEGSGLGEPRKGSQPSAETASDSTGTLAAAGVAWPKEANVKVTGFCPNPRLCVGRIVDQYGKLGATVSIWKGRYNGFRTRSVLPCRLDLVQGSDARYLPV